MEESYEEQIIFLASNWLFQLTGMSYDILMERLFAEEYRPNLPFDENRKEDGLCYRRKMGWSKDCSGPCRLLEMMVALADRCETTMMGEVGDFEQGKWLYAMIESLGLASMCDELYDDDLVEYTLYRFATSSYKPDGNGGLFYIPGIGKDLRNTEIWTQLNWYINWREDNL